MSNSKGYINIGIIVLAIISVLAVGAVVKKNYFSNNVSNQNSNQNSNYSFRFDTQHGGQFDVSYPNTYFAGQDYFSKSTTFKLTGCVEQCDTLVISIPERKLQNVKNYVVDGKEYELQKFANSDGTITLVMNPNWTDKLGSIEIKSYQNIDEPSADFTKIIGSIQFVKEIPIVKITPPPSIAIPASIPSYPSPTPKPPAKPWLTQTEIKEIPAQDTFWDFLSETSNYDSKYFSLYYPKNWNAGDAGSEGVTIVNPEGAYNTYSHAGIIYQNSFRISEASPTSLSVEEIMKDLDQKRDAVIKREYESWQESKASDSRVPEYQQYYKPYQEKQKIVKGDMEFIIFNDLGRDYFIASNRKAWVRGTGSYINDKNSIERKILESITLK